MKKFLAAILIALSTACASVGDLSPNAAIVAATSSVEIIVDQAAGAVMRGRMSLEKGQAIVVKAKKALQKINEAEDALRICGVNAKNCDSVQKILDQVQPLLMEMERDLRAKEGK